MMEALPLLFFDFFDFHWLPSLVNGAAGCDKSSTDDRGCWQAVTQEK